MKELEKGSFFLTNRVGQPIPLMLPHLKGDDILKESYTQPRSCMAFTTRAMATI